MPSGKNLYPPGSIGIPSGLLALNRNPTSAANYAYFLADSLSIDFRVQAFTTSVDQSIIEKGGVKYIIGDDGVGGAIIPTTISDNYSTDLFGTLSAGDVVIYNDGRASGEQWELWYDVSNTGISADYGGGLVYVIESEGFYGWFGNMWDTVGAGQTGNTGNTGADAFVGRRYTNYTDAASVNSAGRIHVQNSRTGDDGRTIKIHRNAAGLAGYAGVTGDLFTVFFPNGVDSAYNDINPTVTFALYNERNNKTWSARVKLRHSAVVDTDYIQFGDDDDGVSTSFFELLSSDSGLGTWSDPNDWKADDTVYLLALADGKDGINGVTGATGQGITYGGLSGGELVIQYIDANGNNIGDPVLTGIISGADGATGEAGEVGFVMSATGASAGSAQNWWGNAQGDVVGTGDCTSGEILYTTVNGTKYIVMSYTPYEFITNTATFTPTALGLSYTEAVDGTNYLNRPGSLYFYQKVNNERTLQLKSFVQYSQVKAGGPTDQFVYLTGITDWITFGNEEDRLGITLSNNIDKVYVLPVPKGNQGIGITFGEIVANTLYLDYIDADGNTFGRFASVQGTSGDPGGMNPFNIPFVTIDDATSLGETNIKVGSRSGVNPQTLIVSGTADTDPSDSVFQYIRHPADTISKSGFLTLFSKTDVTDFGVFRFDTASADQSAYTVTYGSAAKPLTHVAGNISQIIGATPDAGFTQGTGVLFALNVDGPKGFSGNTGIGFTYGNEYFAVPISAKPLQRTNNDPLEIGDKWFCTDVGLEFTFLGTSADSIVGDGGDGVIWVQTNNARQGKQGPKGDKGDKGDDGNPGATGIGSSYLFNTTVPVLARDVVYLSLNQALGFASTDGQRTNIRENWAKLGVGATSGMFIAKIDRFGPFNQIPGDFNSATAWNNSSSHWSPVVTGWLGPTGPDGSKGITGDKVKSFRGIVSDEERHIQYKLSNWNGSNEGAWTTIYEDDGSTPLNIRGPEGSITANGTLNHLVYKNANDSYTTTDSIIRESDGSIILNRYREKYQEITSQTFSFGNVNLNIDYDAPVQLWDTFSADATITVTSVDVELPSIGDGITLYIIPGGKNIVWNVSSSSYLNSGSVYSGGVYVSSQGSPNPNKIEIPPDGVGAMTFKRIADTTLAINYVSFVSV